MDTFLNNLRRLADAARREPDPVPLDVSPVMARIRMLEFESAQSDPLPLGVFMGGAAAAAAIAVIVGMLAFSAWGQFNDPLVAMGSLFDVIEDMVVL